MGGVRVGDRRRFSARSGRLINERLSVLWRFARCRVQSTSDYVRELCRQGACSAFIPVKYAQLLSSNESWVTLANVLLAQRRAYYYCVSGSGRDRTSTHRDDVGFTRDVSSHQQ